MKKIFKVLIVALLFTPFVVNADMGAPIIRPFEAIVTKKGGLTLKSYDNKKTKVIEENTKIKVSGYSDSYSVMIDGYEYIIEKNDLQYIKPVNEEVGIDSEGVNKLDKTVEFEVRVDSVKVFKGPAKLYDTAGELKKGDQVTAFYYADGEEGAAEYYYIQEENIKGWIKVNEQDNDGNSFFWEVNAQPLKVIFVKDTVLNGTTVSENTIYKINYWAYPYLSTGPVIKVNNEYVQPDGNDYEIISETKKIQYMFHMQQYNILLKKNVKLYDTPSLKNELALISSKTKLSTINLLSSYAFLEGDTDTYYLYVCYNNKLGWIKVKGADVEIIESESDELISPYVDAEGDDGEETEEEETTQVVTPEELETKDPEKKNNNTKEMVILSVISAISLAVIAFSSILLLNKKNKKDTLKDIQEELDKTQSLEKVKEDK